MHRKLQASSEVDIPTWNFFRVDESSAWASAIDEIRVSGRWIWGASSSIAVSQSCWFMTVSKRIQNASRSGAATLSRIFLHEWRRCVCRFCTSHLSRVKMELQTRLQPTGRDPTTDNTNNKKQTPKQQNIQNARATCKVARKAMEA